MMTVFDVTEFGATGSGTGDDSLGINAAVAAAARKGGRVYIPAGTYRMCSPLSIPSSPYGMELDGDGTQATFLVQANPALPVIESSPAEGSSVIDLLVKGLTLQYASPGASTSYAVSFAPAKNAAIEQVVFSRVNANFAAGGIYANGIAEVVSIEDCTFGNFHDDGSGKSAVYLAKGASGWNFRDSVFSGSSWDGSLSGLSVDTAAGTVRASSTYFGVFKTGVHFLNSLGGVAPGGLAGFDLEVENNGTGILLDAGQEIYLAETYAGSSHSGAGLATSAAFGGQVTVNGGVFGNNYAQGILIQGGSQYAINGARVCQNSTVAPGNTCGIQVQGNASKVAIAGNVISGANHVYGVYVTGISSYVIVDGNVLNGNAVAGVHCDSTGAGNLVGSNVT